MNYEKKSRLQQANQRIMDGTASNNRRGREGGIRR